MKVGFGCEGTLWRHLADLVTISQLLEEVWRGMVKVGLQGTDLVAKCMMDKRGNDERWF